MNMQPVIARAHRAEPLRRVALSTANGLIYLACEQALAEVEDGALPSIGFPESDVFVWNERVFLEMQAKWTEDGETAPEQWDRLTPFLS